MEGVDGKLGDMFLKPLDVEVTLYSSVAYSSICKYTNNVVILYNLLFMFLTILIEMNFNFKRLSSNNFLIVRI